jgi:hypothetical protein
MIRAVYNCRCYAYYKLGKTKANYRKAISDYDIAIQLGGNDYKPTFQYRDVGSGRNGDGGRAFILTPK